MKELSIEEKAKAYDVAIKKAKSKIKDDKDHVLYEDDIIDLFPELAESESEDERIRKALIKLVKKAGEGYENVIDGVSIENAIAWLEKQGKPTDIPDDAILDGNEDGFIADIIRCKKQGEQKPVPKFKVGDVVRSSNGASLLIVGITDYCYNCDTCATNDEYSFGFDIQDEFELVEQKPAEWSEEDEQMFKTIANSLDRGLIERVWHTTIEKVLDWLKSLKDRVQPKQEWSEEDENISSAIIKRLCGSDALSVSLQSAICWVENVKDRVQPQPKQEWSKEDEAFYQRLEKIVCKVDIEAFQGDRDLHSWLKSLRPQSTWKPSIAQLNALSIVSKGNAPDDIEAIVSLYNDLKKLKG